MLAHVDAGKTTLSEGLLFAAGMLKKLGRVDHRDAFLDTHAIERERGITIFSKQAIIETKDSTITLLDTPGHVDFAAETERTLKVLDYAVLVINATDGVQAHTRTLWHMLRKNDLPVFVFVNKMDIAVSKEEDILSELNRELEDGFVSFSSAENIFEDAAMCSEALMEEYLENGELSDSGLASAIAGRELFPVCFGSALKQQGVSEFLQCIERYALRREYPAEFGARIFKITFEGTNRLTWMKITGGALSAKDVLTNRSASVDELSVWEEKADQIRVYSGAKFTPVPKAEAGTVCAVTGLSSTFPGEGLGIEPDDRSTMLESVLTYRLIFPDGTNLNEAFLKLKSLEEEDPKLQIVWDRHRKEINVHLMGEVQKEVLEKLIKERFKLEVSFGKRSVLYKETIAEAAEGVGHYEPLRHFAHVQLLLEPLPLGSGLVFESAVSQDKLGISWQRLILTHLHEKQHLGVLTGSPITDMRISLTDGRAHLKHTEGGDFRQATYRAVRQGLMCAKSVLLEPYYKFRLELPTENLGRAMTDIKRMGGDFNAPESRENYSIIKGTAPVLEIGDYPRELMAYSGGRGKISFLPGGYLPCKNPEEVIREEAYDPEADIENTPDSVFCSHGAGFVVKWNAILGHMKEEASNAQTREERKFAKSASDSEAELRAIYERTYGPIKDRTYLFRRKPEQPIKTTDDMLSRLDPEEDYLLVDGYNIVFGWEDLSKVARENISLAREMLINMLGNYQGYTKCNLILVFDAYKVTGGEERIEKKGGIYIVYTREAEIADVYIEKTVAKMKSGFGRIRVATSDRLEQLIVLGKGALRISAEHFREEFDKNSKDIREEIEKLGRQNKGTTIWQRIQKNS